MRRENAAQRLCKSSDHIADDTRSSHAISRLHRSSAFFERTSVKRPAVGCRRPARFIMRRTMLRSSFSLLVISAALWSVRIDALPASPLAADCTSVTAVTVDDCVRINQIQLLGTHNSYHIAPAPPILARLGERARNIEYSHRPIAEQLTRLGIRKFELDVFADPEGGRYAAPAALRLVKGLDPVDAQMRKPGFKVLHTQDLDYRSTCMTLLSCLSEIETWSRAHPGHLPIMVMIEAKDSPLEDRDKVGFVQPLPIGPNELRALDEEIRSVFPSDRVITPDRVRGRHATLA